MVGTNHSYQCESQESDNFLKPNHFASPREWKFKGLRRKGLGSPWATRWDGPLGARKKESWWSRRRWKGSRKTPESLSSWFYQSFYQLTQLPRNTEHPLLPIVSGSVLWIPNVRIRRWSWFPPHLSFSGPGMSLFPQKSQTLSSREAQRVPQGEVPWRG